MLPTGNGYFLWLLDRCTGGNPQAMALRAKQSGLQWVAIKIANGIAAFGKDTLNQAVVDAFRSQGISVWGWHYVYGYYPEREAELAVVQTKRYDLDGYIIDAEAEYKLPGRSGAATRYMDILRLGLDKPLGLCSYRFPLLHPEFPWREFLSRVDFNMPQVYWMGAHNAGMQLRKSYSDFKTLTSLPFIPVGAAFTEAGWSTEVADILDFRKTVSTLGLSGYGWWEWYFAETRNPAWWDASTGGVVAEPVPPENAPVMFEVATDFSNLRLRGGPSTSAAIVGMARPGTVYRIVEQSGDWGRVDGVETCWVHLGYCHKVTKVVTHFSDLRIRSMPSLNGTVLGYLPRNVVHKIVSVSGSWGRLEGDREKWVNLTYTAEV